MGFKSEMCPKGVKCHAYANVLLSVTSYLCVYGGSVGLIFRNLCVRIKWLAPKPTLCGTLAFNRWIALSTCITKPVDAIHVRYKCIKPEPDLETI